jgi:hypothetical protein
VSGYTCAACGTPGAVVEVSLVPRVVGVAPVAPDAPAEVDYTGFDEAFWDAETVLGYGCANADCEYWHGGYGIVRGEDGTHRIVEALPLDMVAIIPAPLQEKHLLVVVA